MAAATSMVAPVPASLTAMLLYVSVVSPNTISDQVVLTGTTICCAEYAGAENITLGSILYVVLGSKGTVGSLPGTT